MVSTTSRFITFKQERENKDIKINDQIALFQTCFSPLHHIIVFGGKTADDKTARLIKLIIVNSTRGLIKKITG